MQVLVIAILWLGVSSPANGQISLESLGKTLKTIETKTLTEADCLSQIAAMHVSNGPELIYGGQVCDAVKRPEESSLLMTAGQIRAGTDLLLLPPATRADDQDLMDLYAMLYFGGGVAGLKDEVLRDPSSRQRFLGAFEKWMPIYSPTYDPGWKYRKRPDDLKYRETVLKAKSDLRRYFDHVIHLVSDDQYYSLHRQRMQILEGSRDGIKADTPEGRQLAELEMKIRNRMIALGVDPGPSPADLMADAQKGGDSREFPPSSPEKDEQVLSDLNNSVIERCVDLAERSAVSQGGKIVRVLITSSPRWGHIWRADIEGSDQGPERFTCTETTSSSSPLSFGNVPPLAVSGPQS